MLIKKIAACPSISRVCPDDVAFKSNSRFILKNVFILVIKCNAFASYIYISFIVSSKLNITDFFLHVYIFALFVKRKMFPQDHLEKSVIKRKKMVHAGNTTYTADNHPNSKKPRHRNKKCS